MTATTRIPTFAPRLALAVTAVALAIAGPARAADAMPIFDAHLHYNDEATAAYPVADVLRLFRENGEFMPAWRDLLIAHPDRFVVGSDTWVNERWAQFREIMAYYRGWLAQLPADVASRIAFGNGERLFATGGMR